MRGLSRQPRQRGETLVVGCGGVGRVKRGACVEVSSVNKRVACRRDVPEGGGSTDPGPWAGDACGGACEFALLGLSLLSSLAFTSWGDGGRAGAMGAGSMAAGAMDNNSVVGEGEGNTHPYEPSGRGPCAWPCSACCWPGTAACDGGHPSRCAGFISAFTDSSALRRLRSRRSARVCDGRGVSELTIAHRERKV